MLAKIDTSMPGTVLDSPNSSLPSKNPRPPSSGKDERRPKTPAAMTGLASATASRTSNLCTAGRMLLAGWAAGGTWFNSSRAAASSGQSRPLTWNAHFAHPGRGNLHGGRFLSLGRTATITLWGARAAEPIILLAMARRAALTCLPIFWRALRCPAMERRPIAPALMSDKGQQVATAFPEISWGRHPWSNGLALLFRASLPREVQANHDMTP